MATDVLVDDQYDNSILTPHVTPYIIILVGGLMSKNEKQLQKIKNNPTNVKFETLQSILISYGFSERIPKSGSSHHTFTYKEYIITIPKKKPVKTIYVKKVLSILEDLNLIDKE